MGKGGFQGLPGQPKALAKHRPGIGGQIQIIGLDPLTGGHEALHGLQFQWGLLHQHAGIARG